MLTVDPRALTADSVRFALDMCLKTARAVPEEKAAWKPSDGSKSALEVVRHMVEVNHNIGGAVNGQPVSAEDLKTLMAELTDYPAALKALEQSAHHLAQCIERAPENALQPHAEAWLDPSSPGRLMTVGLVHLVYHWGQLSFLQTLWDDPVDHFLQ